MTIQGTIPQVEVDANALGSIITSKATRRRVYSVWTLIGLAIIGIGAGGFAATTTAIAANSLGLHLALTVGLSAFSGLSGAYAALSPQVSQLAAANTSESN